MSRSDRNVEREAHIWALALDAGIDLEWSRNGRGHAMMRERKIVVPPIRGQVSYVTALHELGHFLGHPRSGLVRLEEEALAWRWALANSEEDLTVATWRSIERCLRSYLARALRRQRMTVPGRDSEFHRLLTEVATTTGTLGA